MKGCEWKVDAVRAIMQNETTVKENCFICNKHGSISELHHVIPVSQLTKLLNMGAVDLKHASTPIVWLCPNCHAYIHRAMDGHSITSVFPKDELHNALKILKAYEEHIKKIVEESKHE